MILNLKGTEDKKAWERAGIALPRYDITKLVNNTKSSPIWVHFGGGNIFRIFIGGIAHRLISSGIMNKGIICAETFDFDVIDKIYKPYDNLTLSVTLGADGTSKKEVYGSITEGLRTDKPEDIKRLREIFSAPSLQLVSFTITEKGYNIFSGNDEFLPFVQSDIDNGPQKASSVMAVLCALLYERFNAGRYPIALVSMDNCSHNGDRLRNAVTEIADRWCENGFVPSEFLNYIRDEDVVSFVWTMIDKITPRPADETARELEELGVEDMSPIVTSKNTYIAPFVNAERPEYLVMEDRFPNGRPPLERAGVYMTDRDNVMKAERMKVTACLNPLHTALAVYGCLLGYDSISDEMQDKELKALVETIGFNEGLPVAEAPDILSPEAFLSEVINERIPNPHIPDTPQRIATDTSQKVGVRYGETIKSYVRRFGTASSLVGIPLAIAGWCRYLLGVDDELKPFELSSDPLLNELREHLNGIEIGNPSSCRGQLRFILSDRNIFGTDLYDSGIGDKTETMFKELIEGRGAVRKTLKKYLNGDINAINMTAAVQNSSDNEFA